MYYFKWRIVNCNPKISNTKPIPSYYWSSNCLFFSLFLQYRNLSRDFVDIMTSLAFKALNMKMSLVILNFSSPRYKKIDSWSETKLDLNDKANHTGGNLANIRSSSKTKSYQYTGSSVRDCRYSQCKCTA